MDWLLVSKRSPEALERRRSLKLALGNEGPKWVLTSDREDVTLVFKSTVMSGRGRWGFSSAKSSSLSFRFFVRSSFLHSLIPSCSARFSSASALWSANKVSLDPRHEFFLFSPLNLFCLNSCCPLDLRLMCLFAFFCLAFLSCLLWWWRSSILLFP